MKKINGASFAVLSACAIAHFFNHVYSGVIAPFLPVIQEELSLTLTEVGLVTSAAILTMTLSHLAVGYLVDKGWRDIFIPATVLMSSSIIVITGFARGFIHLLISMILLGLALSGHHPSTFPALSEQFSKGARAKATGVHAMGGLAGMALIPILGVSLLVLLGNWRDSMLFLGAIGLVVFIPIFVLMRYSKSRCHCDAENHNDFVEEEGEDGWTRNYVLMIFVTGFRGISFRCLSLLMPLYLVLMHGQEPLWAGSLTTIMLATGLVAELISGPISDKVGKRRPLIAMSTAFMIPFLLLLNTHLDRTLLTLVLMAIGFFFYWGVPPDQAFQTEVAPHRSKGLAFGILFSIGALPGALAPFFFGLIGDFYGLQASIMFLVATALMATIVSLLLKDQPIIEKDSVVLT